MTQGGADAASLRFDPATQALVRLSARIAGGSEADVRDGLRETAGADTPPVWVEELILQSYLFCGFPRTLNAAREWRRIQGQGQRQSVVQGQRQSVVQGEGEYHRFLAEGEDTCARVYGKFYERLRHNIVELHPELDRWMIVEGYGKVLSRPGLDLGRRELCIVAACVASGQDRQLHSHLHGARNVGVADEVVGAALDALDGVVDTSHLERAKLLWGRVRGRAE